MPVSTNTVYTMAMEVGASATPARSEALHVHPMIHRTTATSVTSAAKKESIANANAPLPLAA